MTLSFPALLYARIYPLLCYCASDGKESMRIQLTTLGIAVFVHLVYCTLKQVADSRP